MKLRRLFRHRPTLKERDKHYKNAKGDAVRHITARTSKETQWRFTRLQIVREFHWTLEYVDWLRHNRPLKLDEAGAFLWAEAKATKRRRE